MPYLVKRSNSIRLMSEDSFTFLRSFDLVLAGPSVRILRLPVPNALSGQVSLISIKKKKNLNIRRLKKTWPLPPRTWS